MFAFDNDRLNITVNLACFAVFGVFYAIVCRITSGFHCNIVSEAKSA